MSYDPFNVMTETSKPYFGEFYHSMDEKNRVTIPSGWRHQPDGETFYTIPHQTMDCLIVMPPEEFAKVEQMVNENLQISPAQRRSFVRRFYSLARQVHTDRQGRILVPDEHRTPVGLQSEVVLVGGSARFEIWDPGRWRLVSEAEQSVYLQVSELVGI